MRMTTLVYFALMSVVACAPEGNPLYSIPSPVYKPGDSNLFVADQPDAAASTTAAVMQSAPVQGVQGSTLIAPLIDNHQLYNPEGYVDPYSAISYEPGYGLQTGYEGYLVPYGGNYPLSTVVDSIGPLSYIWSLLPHSATVVAVVAKGATLLLSGAGIILAGVAAVFGFCSFTPYCHITMHGFNSASLKEEVRSYITPDRISAAARFVREALDKYQKIQKKSSGKAN